MLMMSLLSVIVLGSIAVGVNNVSLGTDQWLGLLWCRFDWTAASAHDRHRIVVYPSRRNAQSC